MTASVEKTRRKNSPKKNSALNRFELSVAFTLNSNLFNAEFFSERHWRDPRSVSGGLSGGIRDPRKSGQEGVITNATFHSSLRAKSRKTASTNRNLSKRKESRSEESNRGPSAYQPIAFFSFLFLTAGPNWITR